MFLRRVEAGDDSLTARIRRLGGGRRSRAYWLSVLFMAVVGTVLILIFGIGRRQVVSVFPKPGFISPDFQIFRVVDMSVPGQERLSVMAVFQGAKEPESLRAALDWVLYSVLNDYNNRQRRQVQVVWAYLYEDSLAGVANWRAMAIYVDPLVPKRRIPEAAVIGGDAVRVGAVEYDFTNPVVPVR